MKVINAHYSYASCAGLDKLFQLMFPDDRNHLLINIGSCGLHIVHNAFKAGFEATGWDVKSFLWALYTIFYETPARREDYTAITSSVVFPLKFCLHRWVENATVAARALIILPHLKKYVDTIQQNPKDVCSSNQQVVHDREIRLHRCVNACSADVF